MKVLLDTNVVLDVLLKRRPFDRMALPIFGLAETKIISGYVCATAVTTIYYLLRREDSRQTALRHLSALLGIFSVAPVDQSVLLAALQSGFRDYEDGVVYESARAVAADAIVTRNVNDYKKSRLPVYTPEEFLRILNRIKETQ